MPVTPSRTPRTPQRGSKRSKPRTSPEIVNLTTSDADCVLVGDDKVSRSYADCNVGDIVKRVDTHVPSPLASKVQSSPRTPSRRKKAQVVDSQSESDGDDVENKENNKLLLSPTTDLMQKLARSARIHSPDRVRGKTKRKAAADAAKTGISSDVATWLSFLAFKWNVALVGPGCKEQQLLSLADAAADIYSAVLFLDGSKSLSSAFTVCVELLKMFTNAKVFDKLDLTARSTAKSGSLVTKLMAFFDDHLPTNARVLICVDGVDSPALRLPVQQEALLALATHSRIQMVVSCYTVDCGYLPLFVDCEEHWVSFVVANNVPLTKFHWLLDLGDTALCDGDDEEATSADITGKSNVALLAARAVLSSVTERARQIFELLANLAMIKTTSKKRAAPSVRAVPLEELYAKSRAEMIVSSQALLRNQLIELTEHRLVKIDSDTIDGVDTVSIMLHPSHIMPVLSS